MPYSQTIDMLPSFCYEADNYLSDMPHTDSHNDEDDQLMLAIKHDDERALRALIAKWNSPLINFLYRSTHSIQEAEDIAQLVFVKIYHASQRYKPETKFSSYLFNIARRELISRHRSKKRKPLDFVNPSELHAHTATYHDSTTEMEEAFFKALNDIPENHRTAILLFKQQEMSYKEIADAMHTNVSNVKSWIHRARETLREALKDFHHKTS